MRTAGFRFWLFFYGLPNILGMGLLLLGLLGQLVLMLLSTHGGLAYWLAICGLLYVAGWLMGWWLQDTDANLTFEQTLTREQIESEMMQLLRRVKGRIPEPAYALVTDIQTSVLGLLPHLVSGKVFNQDLHTVKQTVFDYLPSTLENYLKLPSAYANLHPVHDGKTAKVLLLEQLTLMDSGLKDITHSIYQQDSQALLVNQRFLEQKLGQVETFLS